MFHTIVLSGGANYTAAFFGCIRYMEHTQMINDVRKVVGSSAGALVALYIALGMTSDEMRAWSFTLCSEYGFNRLDVDILELYASLGMDSGRNMDASIAATLSHKNISAEVTFKELAQARGIDLVVCVLNLTKTTYEYMSVDTTPDVSVRTAIRMSMSVPLIFAPVVHEGCIYVDPVLGRNFPGDYCPGKNVLGLRLVPAHLPTDVGVAAEGQPNFASYISSIVSLLVEQSNATMTYPEMTLVDIEIDADVPRFSAETMAFAWTPVLVASLSLAGYAAIQKVLSAIMPIFSITDKALDRVKEEYQDDAVVAEPLQAEPAST